MGPGGAGSHMEEDHCTAETAETPAAFKAALTGDALCLVVKYTNY